MPETLPTVLVVEDDRTMRLTAVRMVKAMGFQVIDAEHADEAITLLNAPPEIRLVFTDIDMPGSMGGLKLAMYVAKRWPPLKFIIVSGAPFPLTVDLPDGTHFHPKAYRLAAIRTSMSARLLAA